MIFPQLNDEMFAFNTVADYNLQKLIDAKALVSDNSFE